MIEKPVAGAFYWCILPDDEAFGYGDINVAWHLSGILVERRRGPQSRCLELMRTDLDGEPDDDSNATSLVQPADLFPTEEAATVEYQAAL